MNRIKKIILFTLWIAFSNNLRMMKTPYLSVNNTQKDIILVLFTNGSGDRSLIPRRVLPKTQKWYLVPPYLTISIIRYVLYSHNHDTYTFGNIVNTIMTNKHTSLEKYTSHTLFEMVAKGFRKGYVWEVSWRLNKLQHIDPQFLCL